MLKNTVYTVTTKLKCVTVVLKITRIMPDTLCMLYCVALLHYYIILHTLSILWCLFCVL